VKLLKILPFVFLLPLLGACGPSSNATSPNQLPYPPADIQSCFRGAANIPNRALTVSEVEALWKQDRIRSIAQARCGKRMLQWYSQLQADWR